MGRPTIRVARVLALLLVAASPALAEIPPRPPAASEDGAFEPPATGARRLEVATPPYPATVQGGIDEARTACLGAEEAALVVGSGFVRRGDLTGDGRADYVVDFREARCAGAPSPFEGTGGWELAIFVARPTGDPIRVFSGQVLDYDLVRGRRGRAVRFRLHGGRCGRSGPDLCYRTRRIDARPFTL